MQPSFGLSAALVTPFAEDGTLDTARWAEHAVALLEAGCDGVTAFGTTGEGYGIGLRERRTALEALAETRIAFETQLHCGVVDPTIEGAAEQGRQALDAGARGLLVAPPFYLKGVGDAGLFAWFARVFDAIGAGLRGVILYHIPGQTQVPLSVDLVARLREAYPQAITGIKDSSGDWATAEAFLAAHGDLAVLIGDERLLARGMRAGAAGSICGVANIVPERLRAIVHDATDDAQVERIVDLIVSHPILPAVKALVAHRRGDAGFRAMRPPSEELEPARRDALVAAFERLMADAGALEARPVAASAASG